MDGITEFCNSTTIVVVENVDESILEVQELLDKWGFPSLKQSFYEKGIDLECLRYITSEDINVLIPESCLGLRIKFRARIAEWHREKGNCTQLADTVSKSTSDISDLLLNSNSPRSSQSPTDSPSVSVSPSTSHNLQNFNLETVIESSLLGKVLKSQLKATKS